MSDFYRALKLSRKLKEEVEYLAQSVELPEDTPSRNVVSSFALPADVERHQDNSTCKYSFHNKTRQTLIIEIICPGPTRAELHNEFDKVALGKFIEQLQSEDVEPSTDIPTAIEWLSECLDWITDLEQNLDYERSKR